MKLVSSVLCFVCLIFFCLFNFSQSAVVKGLWHSFKKDLSLGRLGSSRVMSNYRLDREWLALPLYNLEP